ncbi:MAG: hypothetical protein INH37_00470 [Myxococcaceae bacterium]|nr:hypothetical protein [Myxococcaceae bacterium]
MIPPMKPSGVLHPFYDWQQGQPGSPASASGISPHLADLVELTNRFGTTPHRRKLLVGLIAYRARLVQLGFSTRSMQWVDGSFVEDKDPNDIDVVTIVEGQAPLAARGMGMFSGPSLKAQFFCDAYGISMSASHEFVESITYWYGLFGHRRGTEEWKGLVSVPLDVVAGKDAEAKRMLVGLGVAP